jgi:hypothetical protein
MSLNEALQFSGVSAEVKAAFLGVPDKIWFKPSTKLYKYSSYPLIGPNGRITPWWTLVEKIKLPSGRVAEGLRGSTDAAYRLNISLPEYEKYRAAVSEKFGNTLDEFLLIALKDGAWGFAGPASGQVAFKDPALSNVYLIGGKIQVWIPNLLQAHVLKLDALG